MCVASNNVDTNLGRHYSRCHAVNCHGHELNIERGPRSQPPSGVIRQRPDGRRRILRSNELRPLDRAPHQPLDILSRQGDRAEDRAQGGNLIA